MQITRGAQKVCSLILMDVKNIIDIVKPHWLVPLGSDVYNVCIRHSGYKRLNVHCSHIIDAGIFSVLSVDSTVARCHAVHL